MRRETKGKRESTMSEEPVQNFENHIRHDKLLYAYLGVFLLAAILAVVGIFTSYKLVGLAIALNAVGTILLAVNARGYGVKVQDRVVRLEMRLRLAKVLSSELASRIQDFKLSQLVGLRFASDEELPELAQKVLDEDITKANDIKRLVKDWQPDHLRV